MVKIDLETTQKKRYRQQWKNNLKAVGDNACYIEQNMVAIAKELKSNQPDTRYLKSKVRSIDKWLDEIDLANERARTSKLRKVI